MIPEWGKYHPYFRKAEFDCKETGECDMDPEFMDKLVQLRKACGFPFVITSGYRATTHSIEKAKVEPGQHTKGRAVDIACHSDNAFYIVKYAMALGFTGIGVSQKNGIARFVHVDMRKGAPVVYSY